MEIGDYCHAHRWSDKDPMDPWSVGYLVAIHILKNGTYYQLDFGPRWYPYCEKITEAQGKEILKRNDLKV